MLRFLLTRLFFTLLIATMVNISIVTSQATESRWATLKSPAQTQLQLDKSSITEEAPYTKAWVTMHYSKPQKNPDSVDREYNHAKALWYFDCKKNKAGTVQVFQYFNNELIYSAGADPKKLDLLEPVPESEVDSAMQYACKTYPTLQDAIAQQVAARKAKQEADKKEAAKKAAEASKLPKKDESAAEGKTPDTKEKATSTSKENAEEKETKKPDSKNAKDAKNNKDGAKDTKTTHKGEWAYQGDQDPSHWSTLSPDNTLCSSGKNQSPIAIKSTIHAALKPIKSLQKFPATTVEFRNHALQINFSQGNMMVIDDAPYQLQYIVIHSPAEHQFKDKTFAAELQLVHQDKKGGSAMIAVMLEEGEANPAIENLLASGIKPNDKPVKLMKRLIPADLVPKKVAYYRYTGSLTIPPCSEGVQWILMKTPISASKAQITALKALLGEDNQRPIQGSVGRMVLE